MVVRLKTNAANSKLATLGSVIRVEIATSDLIRWCSVSREEHGDDSNVEVRDFQYEKERQMKDMFLSNAELRMSLG